MTIELADAPLGKVSAYIAQYQPELLFPVPRKFNREQMGITSPLPFRGIDVWNAFEISWLNEKGKPEVALGEIIVPCESPNLIESKSLKLYLNSLNQTIFHSQEEVQKIIQKDLSAVSGALVNVILTGLSAANDVRVQEFQGICLDNLDISCDHYEVTPELLQVEENTVEETVFSNLLKSNCAVTGQPDWGSVQVAYIGPKIKPESLLRYIVSFRNHQGFHEPCIERIFIDILRRCQPEQLTVHGRYTRRGGLDINPYRSTENYLFDNVRLPRQ